MAQRVAASLGGAHGGHLADALISSAVDLAAFEASVRSTPSGALRAGRMMVEQAERGVVEAIAQAVEVALPAQAMRWCDLGAAEGLPLIAGWDLRGGGAQRCVKLYVNASDASQASRRRLCAALAPAVASTLATPAVLGMNVLPQGAIETKLYLQSEDACALASVHTARAQELAAAARAEGADAGGIVSFDVADDTPRPRAFFVALREPPGAAPWRCVSALPGFDPAVIGSLLPFPPAPPRSAGIGLDDGCWTLYCKPRDSGRAPQSLEPLAIYRSADAEIGVFVEPNEHAARAFRRTTRHAISVRVREGAPSPHALEALVDWFAARVIDAERSGAELAGRLSDPPAPWRAIDA